MARAGDWLLARGRLGRAPYAIGVFGAVAVAGGIILGGVLTFYGFATSYTHSSFEDIWILLVLLPALYILSVLVIRRLHDMNCAGWHTAWIAAMTVIGVLSGGGFWSILALLMHAFLMLNPGRPEANRFGPAS
jgi:uncharacterized membrane protein YhaH (DUF805 family)